MCGRFEGAEQAIWPCICEHSRKDPFLNRVKHDDSNYESNVSAADSDESPDT